MAEINEESARSALLAAHSEAYDKSKFTAQRVEGGWIFRWDEAAGPIPMGTSPWVVADNGRAKELGFTDKSAEVLAQLNSQTAGQ
jgi:hypothetical protein